MTRSALLVMAKVPTSGRTKTRLSPPLSTKEAADLYACLLRDTLELVRSLPNVTPIIAYWPPESEAENYFSELAPDFQLIAQSGDSLGERLSHVLTECLHEGFGLAAAINSDSPTLPARFLDQAFSELDNPATDVVLGPCDDGGYYLIGWKRPHPRLVCNVQMSTDHVLQDTLEIAAAEELTVSLLPTWYDVDDAGDLIRVQADLQKWPQRGVFTRRFLAKRQPILIDPGHLRP